MKDRVQMGLVELKVDECRCRLGSARLGEIDALKCNTLRRGWTGRVLGVKEAFVVDMGAGSDVCCVVFAGRGVDLEHSWDMMC